MVLYMKLGLTLSTAEGNNTAIALYHSTNLLNLTVRALKVWLGQLRHFHFHLQNKVALVERYVQKAERSTPSVIAQCGSVDIARN